MDLYCTVHLLQCLKRNSLVVPAVHFPDWSRGLKRCMVTAAPSNRSNQPDAYFKITCLLRHSLQLYLLLSEPKIRHIASKFDWLLMIDFMEYCHSPAVPFAAEDLCVCGRVSIVFVLFVLVFTFSHNSQDNCCLLGLRSPREAGLLDEISKAAFCEETQGA